MYREQYDVKMKALHMDVQAAYADLQSGKITESRWNHIMSRAEQERDKLDSQIGEYMKAKSFGDTGASNMQEWRAQFKGGGFGGGWPENSKVKQIQAPKGSVQVTRRLFLLILTTTRFACCIRRWKPAPRSR